MENSPPSRSPKATYALRLGRPKFLLKFARYHVIEKPTEMEEILNNHLGAVLKPCKKKTGYSPLQVATG